MGYRHKIGVMPKIFHDKIKHASSYKELYELVKGPNSYPAPTKLPSGSEYLDDYLGCYEITEEIYELGKYVDDSFLKPFRSEVFFNKELVDKYNKEQAFYIISKEGFKAIIKDHHEKVLTFYKDLLEGKEEVKGYLAGKIYDWTPNNFNVSPYFLDENKDSPTVVRSYRYEYQVFELARLYKSIDWNNSIVTITAW